jgi:hypothetical protein
MTVKRIGGQSNLSRIPREQLEAQHMALLGQLGEARMRFSTLNAVVCALLKEKHGGRAFVSIPAFAETQGWTMDIAPQKSLGNIRLIAVDGNGHPQIADDRKMAPTDVPCCWTMVMEDCTTRTCGAPAMFAEGLDAEGKAINPRCSAHLPENAQVVADQPIVTGNAIEEPVELCGECGRKKPAHNLDCSHYNES